MSDNTERDKALKKAYSAATSTLRKKYQDEFNEAYKAEASALGYEVTLRPTPEQRAHQQVKELLAAHPEVKAQLVAEVAASLQGPDPDEDPASE